MATQLEDIQLPDFKLRVAEVQRQWRQVEFPRTIFNTNDETTSSFSKPLLEDCRQTWFQVRTILIRNGTDQCLAALRRLLDDRSRPIHWWCEGYATSFYGGRSVLSFYECGRQREYFGFDEDTIPMIKIFVMKLIV
jgi:hypothetical protein